MKYKKIINSWGVPLFCFSWVWYYDLPRCCVRKLFIFLVLFIWSLKWTPQFDEMSKLNFMNSLNRLDKNLVLGSTSVCK